MNSFIKVEGTINMNKDYLFLSKVPCGKNSFEIKLGRKLYICDVTKNVDNAMIDFYHKKNPDRTKYSKHDMKDRTFLWVRGDAVLTRDFFEHIKEIAAAQSLCEDYKNILRR